MRSASWMCCSLCTAGGGEGVAAYLRSEGQPLQGCDREVDGLRVPKLNCVADVEAAGCLCEEDSRSGGDFPHKNEEFIQPRIE